MMKYGLKELETPEKRAEAKRARRRLRNLLNRLRGGFSYLHKGVLKGKLS
jgi:hypothetical protein